MYRKLDTQRILSAGIPDIATVYGGVRGRTMSSRHQNYAWDIISEAGIHTIIDLREDGTKSSLPEKCRQHGMTYFHYPVDNKCNSIDRMVTMFDDLCRHIDAGNFYIACAMGLHRTDIALCTYWVFYAADKGMEPPQIIGYSKESGHDTCKINRVLNRIYSYLTEKDGKEPMPAPEFKRRKEIIKQSSK